MHVTKAVREGCITRPGRIRITPAIWETMVHEIVNPAHDAALDVPDQLRQGLGVDFVALGAQFGADDAFAGEIGGAGELAVGVDVVVEA